MQACLKSVYVVVFVGLIVLGCSHEKLSEPARITPESRTLDLIQSLTIEDFEHRAAPQVQTVYRLNEIFGTWSAVAAYCRKADGRTAKEFSPSGLSDEARYPFSSYDEEKDGLRCEMPFSKIAIQKMNNQTGAEVHIFTAQEDSEDREKSGRYFAGLEPQVGKLFYRVAKLVQDPCFAFVYPTPHVVVVIRRQACG